MRRRSSRCRGGRLTRLGVAVGTFVLGASVLAGGPAQAVSGTASGYWSAGPVSPGVPPKSMWVAADPTGPVAIAAIRLTLDAGEAPPVIVSLQVDRMVPANGASIFACPTTAPWEPAEGGPLTAAPKYDCDEGRVVGTPSSDGTRLVFDATPLATAHGLDVALVPTPASNPVPAAVPVTPPPSTASFSAMFMPFTPDQVSVLTAPAVAATGGPAPSAGGGATSAPNTG